MSPPEGDEPGEPDPAPTGVARLRGAEVALATYALICLAALATPGYLGVGNRIEPYVLGLPLSLAWNVGWVALTFVVLVAYHLRRAGRG